MMKGSELRRFCRYYKNVLIAEEFSEQISVDEFMKPFLEASEKHKEEQEKEIQETKNLLKKIITIL